jgi:xanthine dehydrogenase YagT iron-sulfur-binding subunit
MGLIVGGPAPDFVFEDQGRITSLTALRGAPVIVSFPAAEHRASQPVLQRLEFEGVRLVVLAPTEVGVAERYGVRRSSAVFVVSSGGDVIWRHVEGDAIETVSPKSISRREFVAAIFAASIAVTLATDVMHAATIAQEPPAADYFVDVAFVVNGRPARLTLDPRVTLLDVLREQLHLTGSRKGCDHGQCGACTVHVDSQRVLSCLMLAATVAGRSITTIEGLAKGERLHPMQQAFIDHDGFQCGYCTSGQIMSAVALLHEPCGPDDDDVRECMSGNICRCGAYPGIVAAVQSVRGNRT